MRNSTEVETKIIHIRGQEKKKQTRKIFVCFKGRITSLLEFVFSRLPEKGTVLSTQLSLWLNHG